MTPLQSSFEHWARRHQLDLTPPCFHITYYTPETQNAWVDWIERDLAKHPAYFVIEGQSANGAWSTLEQRRDVTALP